MTIHRYLNQGGFGGNYTIWFLLKAMKDAGWKIIESGSGTGGKYSETGATGSISNVSGDTWQITDTGSFEAAMVGAFVTITNGETGNDGIFEITAADGNHVEYVNASAQAEGPDTFNWKITGDVFDQSDNPKTGPNVTDLNQAAWGDEHFGGSRMWVRIQDPAGTREFLFQRGAGSATTDDDEWWVGYSRADKFVGGTPDEDTAPDATDEQTVSSTGTKATPGSTHSQGTVSTLIHVAADDTASGAGCYGVICFEMIATNEIKNVFIADDLQNAAAGDTDAYALSHTTSALTETNLFSTGQNKAKVWVDVGGAGEAWVNGVYLSYRDGLGNAYFAVGKTSKYDGKERPMPMPAVDPSTGGYLGMSRWLNWAAVARDYPNSGDSFNLLYVDEVIILDLWDGATTPQSI